MRAFLFLCLFAPGLAIGAEVRVTIGMSYDSAVANIKKCGGKDTTANHAVGQRSGLYWWLKGYDIQIAVGQQDRKVSSLSFWRLKFVMSLRVTGKNATYFPEDKRRTVIVD